VFPYFATPAAARQWDDTNPKTTGKTLRPRPICANLSGIKTPKDLMWLMILYHLVNGRALMEISERDRALHQKQSGFHSVGQVKLFSPL
jgi:hypothetical protein